MAIYANFKGFFILLIAPLKWLLFRVWSFLNRIIFPGPRGRLRWAFLFIFILTFLAFLLDYPTYYDRSVDWLNSQLKNYKYLDQVELSHFPYRPFHLGLDLQGGTYLVYNADTSEIEAKERADALEGVRDVIERRVNALGVAEPIVQTNRSGDQWRVIVELAGVKDVNEAIRMIGETPLLEFKERNDETERELTEAEQKQLEDFNKQARDRAEEILKKAHMQDADFSALAKEYSEDEKTRDNGGSLGLIQSSGIYSDIYKESEKIGVGNISQELFENSDGYNILYVEAKDESEMEVKANHILICYKGAERCDQDISKDDALLKINELKEKATPENFIDLAKKYSTEPGAENTGGDLGWFSKGKMVPEFEQAVFNMDVGEISDVIETQFGYHLIYKTAERPLVRYNVSRILIKKKKATDILPPPEPWKKTELTGEHLKKAQVQFDPNTGEAQVGLEFDSEGKDIFADITERNIGKQVAIFLDGRAISTPVVQDKISDGRAVITGNFSIDEAKLLARRLNAGALPVPIKLINQQTVGASLGHESVQKSLRAAIFGLIAVALFMMLFYRLPGFLSVIALAVYGIIMLALFKLIPVTLTLAGIAGFILSIGMAVDANVLVFERLREELSLGKTLVTSIDEGFARAWPSIRDGNISTLITCIILSTFGTSIIKGFAITLGIGILVSMFSAIVVTKIFLKLVSAWTRIVWMYGMRKNMDNF